MSRLLAAVLAVWLGAPVWSSETHGPLPYQAPASVPQLGGIESVRGGALRLDPEKPLVAVFDFHGTLVKPTWREGYVMAYRNLTGETSHDRALEWVNQNLIGINTEEAARRLAAVSGASDEDADRVLKQAHHHYNNDHFMEAMEGALQFVDALRQKGVPVIVTSGGERNVILRQLKEGGFLDMLGEEGIFGKDDMGVSAPGRKTSDEHRDNALESLRHQFPGYEFVHFNDLNTGFRGIRRLGGTNVALPQGKGQEFEDNRQTLIKHGADFILRDGWSGYRQLLSELKISEDMQRRAAQRMLPTARGKAQEVALLLPAPRQAGLSLHIDVSDDLKALTYSEVLDDSSVFRRGGVHFNSLKLREISMFASGHLLSPIRYIQHHLSGAAKHAVDHLWPQNKRYTRYRGITVSWDQSVDRDVWTTNIDTVFLHKRLQDSGLLEQGGIRKAVEIGVGGGHISALLASQLQGLEELSITDISLYALRAAKRNILPYLEAGTRLRTYLGKGLESIPENFDLIVVNPPYIPMPPGDSQDASDPYRGTGLIREIVEKGLEKLNPSNPNSGIVINISSMGQKDFEGYAAQYGQGLKVEKLGEPLAVPLKIGALTKEWLDWLVAQGGLEFDPNAAPDQEPYRHRLQVYRLTAKP